MLSEALFHELRPEFFRILSGPNAAIYIDALNALDLATPHPTEGIARTEASAVVEQLLTNAPFTLQDEPHGVANAATAGEQANGILNRLIATGWLEEPTRTDYRRVIYFDANGEVMLEALRRLANPNAAQFTGKLRLVCDKLAQVFITGEFSWDDLEACVENTRHGLQELRQMQKSVERLTRRQLASRSLRENLQVLYDEFSETIGHSCYRELVRAQLPSKLIIARRELEKIAQNAASLEPMQREVLKQDPLSDAASAMDRVRLKIDELIRALSDVEPQADRVDERTAEFARRSFARFRYLQEIGSSRRQQMQTLFEWFNTEFAGKRMVELDDDVELPQLRLHEVGMLRGIDSLLAPRLRRSLGEIEPISADSTEAERDACLAEMERNLRDSLTVMRANHFVQGLALQPGERVSSADIALPTSDEVADLIACLLHAESNDAAYRVEVQRLAGDSLTPEVDRKAGYAIERFDIEKK